jgi:hypothetical protein
MAGECSVSATCGPLRSSLVSKKAPAGSFTTRGTSAVKGRRFQNWVGVGDLDPADTQVARSVDEAAQVTLERLSILRRDAARLTAKPHRGVDVTVAPRVDVGLDDLGVRRAALPILPRRRGRWGTRLHSIITTTHTRSGYKCHNRDDADATDPDSPNHRRICQVGLRCPRSPGGDLARSSSLYPSRTRRRLRRHRSQGSRTRNQSR